ncbi:MAG: hypothetical protein KAS32_01825 [Candidatus Peribacteraceae bacterium]|nr:hypothetical protein [Candidatus Peribacteraceae bacterium]
MKVKDLKKLLIDADDDMEVVVDVSIDRRNGRININDEYSKVIDNKVVLDIDC